MLTFVEHVVLPKNQILCWNYVVYGHRVCLEIINHKVCPGSFRVGCVQTKSYMCQEKDGRFNKQRKQKKNYMTESCGHL